MVIIGGGASGSAAAEMLRRCGYDGRITVVDDDPSAPYDRPNLSKDYLAGNAPEEWIPLRPEGFYAGHKIHILRARAQRINSEARTVDVDGHGSLRYDALLLATGAEPVHLPLDGGDLPHVHYLRTLADSRALVAAAKEAKHAVVIGSSFIGLEVAASLRARRVDVHIVSPDSLPLARILGDMEIAGILVDVGVLRELGQSLGEECARLERQMQDLAGFPFNPMSPKQLGELLFERLGLRGDRMRRVKSGAFSTDAEQLEELVDDHPIIKPILEHRELIKLKGTYLDALPAHVSPEDGRLHTSYIQVGASTGRLASQNPNVQNIPIRTAVGR
ncbi:MAG TPA: DNA polymerase, partial [Caldimonas sp.]|nr:DNA polymerase [Caldimonas sp.]